MSVSSSDIFLSVKLGLLPIRTCPRRRAGHRGKVPLENLEVLDVTGRGSE